MGSGLRKGGKIVVPVHQVFEFAGGDESKLFVVGLHARKRERQMVALDVRNVGGDVDILNPDALICPPESCRNWI